MHGLLDEVPHTLRSIHTNATHLMLATGQAAQTPYVCHVPYVWHEDAYCVWIADVTEPIRHLRLAQAASVMLLEHGHGQQSTQLIWIVEASEVAYQSPQYSELLQQMCLHSNVDLQAALSVECHAIYRLKPINGRLITDLNEIIALIAKDLHEAMAIPQQKTVAIANV